MNQSIEARNLKQNEAKSLAGEISATVRNILKLNPQSSKFFISSNPMDGEHKTFAKKHDEFQTRWQELLGKMKTPAKVTLERVAGERGDFVAINIQDDDGYGLIFSSSGIDSWIKLLPEENKQRNLDREKCPKMPKSKLCFGLFLALRLQEMRNGAKSQSPSKL